jgi:hypothetical protein
MTKGQAEHMPLYALSPAGFVTGGPESMHQLVHTARSLGIEAYIHYYGDGDRSTPAAYSHYDVKVSTQIIDAPESVLVAPESGSLLLKTMQHCRRAMWWLSVNDFIAQAELVRGYQTGYCDRAPFDYVFDPRQKVTHLSHSEYGRLFLATKGVNATPLGDYVSDKITNFCTSLAGNVKLDRIAYNPLKGKAFTEALIAASAGELEWVPIQGMTAEGVAETLSTSKLYIDFGEHPGQDHLPKEAALAGCCMLTGTRGAAGNRVDIAIPTEFKMNEAAEDAVGQVLKKIRWMLANFADISPEFDAYRAGILRHKKMFSSQISGIFGSSGPLSTRPKRR